VGSYILRRLLISIPVLVGITIAGFFALSLTPGDPITARMSPSVLARLSPEAIALARHQLGLDAPIPIRYLTWLAGVVQGDFGYSVVTGKRITDEVLPRLGPTLLLMSTATTIGLVVGIPLGVVSAIRQHGRIDVALTTIALMMAATPTFVIGLLGIYVFAVDLHVLPPGNMTTLGSAFSIGDVAAHLVLPATILGLANASPLMRYTRASMIEVLGSEYLTTARSKGLANSVVVVRHGLRNALIPIITLVGLLLPDLVGGAIITEQVFAWPGMGQLAVRAASDRDPALMMGVILIVSVAVLFSNLLADVAYGVADPRIRYERAR
jgi:peptide/nickel transport system permease protein